MCLSFCLYSYNSFFGLGGGVGGRVCVSAPWSMCVFSLPLIVFLPFCLSALFSVSSFPLIIHNRKTKEYFRLSLIFHLVLWCFDLEETLYPSYLTDVVALQLITGRTGIRALVSCSWRVPCSFHYFLLPPVLYFLKKLLYLLFLILKAGEQNIFFYIKKFPYVISKSLWPWAK